MDGLGRWVGRALTFELPQAMNERLLSGSYAGRCIDFGALPCGYVPIDCETFVMNNDGSKKEAVGRTYQGVDGYTPSVTYLGTQGYCLELALRPGVQHSAMETELNLERVLPMAAKLTPQRGPSQSDVQSDHLGRL